MHSLVFFCCLFFNTLSFKVSIGFVFKDVGKHFLPSAHASQFEAVALAPLGRRWVGQFTLCLKFSSCSLDFLINSNTSTVRQSGVWRHYLFRTELRNEGNRLRQRQSGHWVILSHSLKGLSPSAL